MATLAVVGRGRLPGEPGDCHTSHGLRFWQMASAVGAAGHVVRGFLVDRDDAPGSVPCELEGGASIRVLALPDEVARDGDALARALGEEGTEAVVTTSTLAGFLCASSPTPLPLWIDLNGDPLAEAQALALERDDDAVVGDHSWALAACLVRGDRFSGFSAAQRAALLGQLGLAGRLNRHTAAETLAHAIPGCLDPSAGAVAGPADDGPFVVLFSGSFNTWTDDGTLLDALEPAFAGSPDLRFVATGGAIRGFLEGPWSRFADRVARLPEATRRRIDLRGWVEVDELRRIEAHAGCGVLPERPLAERELGGQNRGLRWMARGLPVVTTALCEMNREMAAAGVVRSVPPGDPRALAEALVGLARDRGAARELGGRGRAWVERRHSVAATTAPLVEWLRAPRPAADRAADAIGPLARRQAEILRAQLTLAERPDRETEPRPA